MDDELATLRSALETHRKERDRYEKASEVAMVALQKEVAARQADVTELLAALDSVIEERDRSDTQLKAAEIKIAKLDLTILAILRKLTVRLHANDEGAIDAAKDVLRAILEELSPGTTLDELLAAVNDTTARRLLLFPHGQTHDEH